MDQEKVNRLSEKLVQDFSGFVLSTNQDPDHLIIHVDRAAYEERKFVLCRAIEDFDPFLSHEYVMVN